MKAEDILSEVLRRYEEALKKRGVSAKTLAEAQDLSGKLGKDLGRILAEELLKAFPAGAVPEDVAMGVIPAALRENSSVVSGFVREIQKRLNEAARVPTPPESRFRYERAANLARWVSKQESFADHETIFSQYVEQNSRMTVDDAVRDQVKAHYGMGLSPKIIRKAAPGCCDWCTKHAGTVDYSKGMDKEIFRRHKNCPCLIEYDPGDGAKRTVNNYRFGKDADPAEVERRKELAKTIDDRIPPKVRELTVKAAQDDGEFKVPAEYEDSFDLPELTLEKQEEDTLRELRRLSDTTGFEHGAIINENGETAFMTDNDPGSVTLNFTALDGEHLLAYHSHTSQSPFSFTDFETLANPRVDAIGVSAYGKYTFVAKCYLTERPSVDEIKRIAIDVKDTVHSELTRDPRWYDWTPSERQFMEVYERFRRMASELGCDIQGGILK